MKKLAIATCALSLALLGACASTYHTYPIRPAPVNHPVFITLNDPHDLDAIIADCDRMIPEIPGVIAYYCGVPLDTGRDTVVADYDLGLYVGFESIEAYEGYVGHPNHVYLLETWGPRIKTITIRDVLDQTK